MHYGLFAFCSTFAVYNGQRLIKSATQIQTPWLDWVRKNEKPLYLWVFSASFGAISCLFLIGEYTFNSLALIATTGLLSLFYIVPVRGRNLRESPYIKIHLIAITWAVVLIAFPVFNSSIGGDEHRWATLAHYCYILAVTIPFDIRDLKYDRRSQRTLPQLLGVPGSKILALSMIAVFAAIMLWQFPTLSQNGVFYGACLIQMIFIAAMTEERGDGYCAGGIDGGIAILGLAYFF